MTAPKPFTAEQLDAFEAAIHRYGPASAPLRSDETLRLIAQAREEIRLREGGAFRAGAEAFKRAAIENEEARLKRELDNVTHAGTAGGWRLNYTCRHVELPTEDPAARAKRELGEWLVDHNGASCHRDEPGPITETWGALLMWHDGNRQHFWRGDGPTEHEAITAALREAKGGKP